MRQLAPVVLGAAFFLIPLFPAFITLTGAAVPGVVLLPKSLTVVLLAVACAIAAYFALVLATTRGEPVPTLLPLATFPLAAAVAALLGFDARAGALFIVILVFGLLWHAAVVRFFGAPGVARAIYTSFLLSGALASVLAVVMVLTKTPASAYTVGHGRAIGTFIVPGELAGYLIVYVPVAFALATGARRELRALAWSGLVIAALAFVLTFSRAASIGMTAAIAFFVLVLRGRRGAGYALAVAGAALAALAVVFNAHHDPSENFTRISIWQAALAMFERFPLSGVGPFEFTTLYPLVRSPDAEPVAYHAHSFVLTAAAETGLVGLTAVAFGWWRFGAVFRARLRGAARSPALALAIVAGLVGTWVQGVVDTVSVVIFALWYPFTGLALAELSSEPAAASRSREFAPRWRAASIPPPARIALGTALGVALVLCALVQLGSDAAFARAASPASLAAHLPAGTGARVYGALERVTPLPFVEATLTDDALRRGDLAAAAAHAARLPAGALRDEDDARIALARGADDEAIRRFLDAGDDGALQTRVMQLIASGRNRDAYALEDRVRRRLAAAKTRPNAVADSWWRLGRLAVRLGAPRDARDAYARASALAPLNTKYLIDSGTLALQDRRPADAASLFARAAEIDPGSADAVAGMGIAALARADRTGAQRLAARAMRLNARAPLAIRLAQRLSSAGEDAPLRGRR